MRFVWTPSDHQADLDDVDDDDDDDADAAGAAAAAGGGGGMVACSMGVGDFFSDLNPRTP